MQYYLKKPNTHEQEGPLSEDELQQRIKGHQVGEDWRVCWGEDSWVLARNFPGFAKGGSPDQLQINKKLDEIFCGSDGLQKEKSDQNSDLAVLLRTIIQNQESQLKSLSAIRWAILGIGLFFVIQFLLIKYGGVLVTLTNRY